MDDFSLLERQVHVWRADLFAVGGEGENPGAILAEDERAQAARFHFEEDRKRYCASHAIVRILLGRYLGREPGDIRYEYGAHGKPALAGGFGETGLRFNMSHSGRLGLFAFAMGREVGVDVERASERRASADLARRFFAAGEVAAIEAFSGEEMTAAFFRCWSRKEAFIKATGQGLSATLDGFEVSVTGEGDVLKAVYYDPAEADRWMVRGLDVGSGYAGAVAVDGKECGIACFEFPRQWPGDREGAVGD